MIKYAVTPAHNHIFIVMITTGGKMELNY